ncbi:MAG: hypothetical protein ACLQPH_02305 [Acidimicrobiales bacterium]
MPDDRTTATELGTALGTLPYPEVSAALADRPGQLHLGDDVWDRLDEIHRSGRLADQLTQAFANGRALLDADDGLRGRPPRMVEWTGGRRSPGDEVAPIDLRIDHVYLVSCKYESDILANASPGRVFEGLLATTGEWDRGDWYRSVAPEELGILYRACLAATSLTGLPPTPGACSRDQLVALRSALAGRSYPDAASRAAYASLCRAVSRASATRWSDRLASSGVAPETMLWRLLRIGSAPYFVLGNDRRTGAAARFRIAGPWDWREQFEMESFAVAPAAVGQPRVDWAATFHDRHDSTTGTVRGHVEIRWSHGRFAQPPEAKVYLDTPMSGLPGYYPLELAGDPQLTFWESGR